MRVLRILAAATCSSVIAFSAAAQQNSSAAGASWSNIESGCRASLRGLSIAGDQVIWATGTSGTFVHSRDGGKTWQADSMAGARDLDFRDVHAVDANTVYLMSVGPGARSRIYKTRDSGRSWQLQFTMPDSAGFLDGFEFWETQPGIPIGDPLAGHLYVIMTSDGGETWEQIAPANIPPVMKDEYAFAASGTSIAVQGKAQVWIGTGGAAARVFHSKDGGKSWQVTRTPLPSGSASAGIFSLAFYDEKFGIAVGGDYRKPEEVLGSLARTNDGGETWTALETAPLQFRSCVCFIPNTKGKMLVAAGILGADYSRDGGRTWTPIAGSGFNTLAAGASQQSIWAAGSAGQIAKLLMPR